MEHGHRARDDRRGGGRRRRGAHRARRARHRPHRARARRRAADPFRMSYPIAVLVSGRGTNLQAILDACASGAIDASVVFVASNRAGVPALVRADRAGVPHGAFTTDEYKTRAATHGAMADALVAAGARPVVCAGFVHLLAPLLFANPPGGPFTNSH